MLRLFWKDIENIQNELGFLIKGKEIIFIAILVFHFCCY